MKAYSMIRPDPHYRSDAFAGGLRAAGYEVHRFFPSGLDTKPGDVLVIWNRYGEYHEVAKRFEARGGTVLVAENGYIGFDADGIQHYAISIGGHNGSGTWHPGDGSRWAKLGIALQPWRDPVPTGHVAVRGQRGIGVQPMASPPNWHHEVGQRLRKVTQRALRIVEHPGSKAVTDQAHVDYLRGAHALVVWASSVGVKALAMGIPVVSEAPHWICKGACVPSIDKLDAETWVQAYMDDVKRLAAFESMAWAQWSVAEIRAGLPFKHLLQREAVAA